MMKSEPWWMPKVIEFIDNYIELHMVVLEFGSGASTVWLAKRCSVISVEEESWKWYCEVDRVLHEMEDKAGVACVIWKELPLSMDPKPKFDLLILDGGDRVSRGILYYPWVKKNGIIMLDDSERAGWYNNLFRFMRGLPRRDFIGELDGKKNRRTTIWKKV